MANPLLNDKTFKEVTARDGGSWAPPPADTWHAPIDDGPVGPWGTTADVDRMTIGGTIQAAAILFGLSLIHI